MTRAAAEAALRIETVELPNGLRVLLAPGPHLHRTAVAYVAQVGARFEEQSTAGLSHFLEHMLHRGTPSFPTAHALASGIETLGASLDAATGVDRGSLLLTTPPENLLDAVEVLGEVANDPIFADVEVERGIVKEELLEDRDDRGRLVDPDGIVRSMVFPDHALGFPIVGTPSTLRRFSVPMLREHHARHYTTKTAAIAIAGKLPSSRAKLLRTIERAFGRTRPGKRVAPPRFRAPASRAPLFSITRSSSSQASIRVACVGPGRKDPKVSTAELLIRLIDDGNATLLYERLCDRRGLCYEVSAGFEAYDEAGLLDIAAESHEDAIGDVLTEILGILRELATTGAPDAEVAKAVQRARWQAARSLDLPETTAEQLALGVLSGEPLTLFDRAERMAEITPRKVRDLARTIFRPERLAIAVVGSVSRSTERELKAIVKQFAASMRA